MRSFQKNTIWIIGASSGIGEQIVYQLAKEDAICLILSSRDPNKLVKVAENAKLTSKNCQIVALDIATTSQVEEIYNRVLQENGNNPFLDGIIFCQGVSQRASFQEIRWEVFCRIVNTNFYGAVFFVKKFLPFLKQGSFIGVVSSVQAKFGLPYRTAYAASKHALHGFFDSLRYELLPRGIQITLACPGYVRTGFSQNALTADGMLYARSDLSQQNGVSPQKAAQIILRAIRRRKREIVFGGAKERAAYWLSRFFPSLFYKILSCSQFESTNRKA
ncbi:MAG: SDR family NAD(P)-dependent oxidoreductase [Cytophagales bacterium]|nr:SDR family NAD(P)-dependent oxidoreductase [Cytophagales bacterium]MDW8383824.1 SDR family NAD(P)-dependent oxidoreductase [Flammeovirgaceae bacterium]